MEYFQIYTFMLDKPVICAYNMFAFGVWRSLVSRLVRDQEASGSNPDTPTITDSGFDTLRIRAAVRFRFAQACMPYLSIRLMIRN